MKKKFSILSFEIISTIFIIVLGTILHFTYDWSGDNFVVSLFSAVNESTWEHLKLVFVPMTITTIIGSLLFRKDYPFYFCNKIKGIILAMLLIVILFYTYTGVLGKNYAFFDISLFFIAVIVSQINSYKKIISNSSCNNLIAVIILIVLIISFFIFTVYPPNIGIFNSPITK